MLPTDAKELKEYMDHCESIEADCVETLHNTEVAEHDQAEHRKLRAQARQALAMLKKVQL